MLKQLMPRTLFGRSLVILVTPFVLLQIIATYVFYERHWDDVSRRLALGLAGDISMVITLLGADFSPARQAEVRALASKQLNLDVTWLPDHVLAGAPPPFQVRNWTLDRMLSRALDERLRRPYRIDTASLRDRVEVKVQLADGTLRVFTSRKRVSSSTTIIFVMWMVGVSLVLLAIAIVFLRNQMRPIRRLATAADNFGKGRDVPDLKPSGAEEVRQATRAFVRMRARIERQIRQRIEMLAGVSHDLRTPLTRIKLQLAMLGDGAEIDNLAADVRDMEAMVEGYLAFARGQDAEATVPADLARILGDVVNSASRQGGEISLTTSGDMNAALKPNAFKRCVTNLVDNARRYGTLVAVEATRNGETIEVAVDDNGPGIAPEQRADALLPFRRLDASRNPETGGVGLGLAIARDVAQSHGGDLTLEAAPLGGLRALVRLPV